MDPKETEKLPELAYINTGQSGLSSEDLQKLREESGESGDSTVTEVKDNDNG